MSHSAFSFILMSAPLVAPHHQTNLEAPTSQQSYIIKLLESCPLWVDDSSAAQLDGVLADDREKRHQATATEIIDIYNVIARYKTADIVHSVNEYVSEKSKREGQFQKSLKIFALTRFLFKMEDWADPSSNTVPCIDPHFPTEPFGLHGYVGSMVLPIQFDVDGKLTIRISGSPRRTYHEIMNDFYNSVKRLHRRKSQVR